MATITDIAKASGVSKASVSYVLNNRQGEVSAATRERVLAAMRELNYRPSPLFMRKHATRAEALGVVFMHPSLTMLTDHPFFTLILDGILSVTTAIGWDLTMFTTSAWQDLRKTLRTKCDGRCDGLMLIGLGTGDELIEVLKERGMPFACINMGSDLPDVDSVDVDNAAAIRQMTEYLIGLGHRKIALLPGQDIYPNARDREVGFKAAMSDAGIALPSEWVPVGGFTEESGYERGMQILSLPLERRPTALVCASDLIAFGAMNAAKELGLRVPDDVSITGFDDIPRARTSEPSLTTIRQPLVDMGRRATEILLQKITEFVEPAETAILPTELIIRASSAPPKN